MEEKYLKNLIGLSCKIAANTKSSETFLIVSIREVIRTRIPMLMLMNFRSGVFTSKGLDAIALLPSCKIRLGQRLNNMSAQRSSGNTGAEPEQILTPSAAHPEGKALPVTHAATAEIDFLDEIIAVSEAEHPGFADAVDAAYQGRGPWAWSTVSPPVELEQIVQLYKSVSLKDTGRADLKNWFALGRFIEDLQDKYHFPEPD
tara:strand:+ start:1233 stop:1838 length:606 start_codon:yes stop_codon:yes gene_type:complete